MSFLKQKLRVLVSKYFEMPISWFIAMKVKQAMKRSERLILVHTIGKVGSSSVFESLKKAFSHSTAIFHVHSLNPARIAEQKSYYRNSKRGSIPMHLIISTAISEQLASFSGSVYVITLVREPIARELSSIFQDYFNFSDDPDISSGLMRSVAEEKIKGLSVILPEETWFDAEVKDVFGIDVMEGHFPLERSYRTWRTETTSFALIRMEDLSDRFSTVVLELFGEENVELERVNDSSDKFYNDSYKAESNSFKIPRDRLEAILDRPFLKKFYSDRTDLIRERWQK